MLKDVQQKQFGLWYIITRLQSNPIHVELDFNIYLLTRQCKLLHFKHVCILYCF